MEQWATVTIGTAIQFPLVIRKKNRLIKGGLGIQSAGRFVQGVSGDR